MSSKARIDFHDLLPPAPEADAYRLSWRSGRVVQSRPVPEGETVVGSAPGSGLRITAPGVRSRHLRLERSGASVFVESLGGARVVCRGRVLRGLTRLGLAQPFTFGTVTANVDRVQAADAPPALPLARRPAEKGSPDAVVHLTQALERVLAGGGSDRLLEAVAECAAPVRAAFYRLEPGGACATLAELAAPGLACPPSPQGWGEAALRFAHAQGARELVLMVEPSTGQAPEWHAAVCRAALLLGALAERTAPLRPRLAPPRNDPWGEFVGARLRAHLRAHTEALRCADTVLVLGETGTGKELAAAAIHRLWDRKGPLLALNCAAVPAELLDAELFGIEKGAAAGVLPRLGRIRQAEGGTLFLDEISEMPPHLQAKLLRFIEQREYFSVGGSRRARADVRVVAASNHPPARLRGERLRGDLYFRLAQCTLELPPLRERLEDVGALCECFLNESERRHGRQVGGLGGSALERLRRYPWPGNVRELRSVLQGAYAQAAPGSVIRAADLPADLQPPLQVPAAGALASIVAEVERQAVEREIARAGSNRAAAKALGLSEGYFYRKLRKLGLAGTRAPDRRP